MGEDDERGIRARTMMRLRQEFTSKDNDEGTWMRTMARASE